MFYINLLPLFKFNKTTNSYKVILISDYFLAKRYKIVQSDNNKSQY